MPVAEFEEKEFENYFNGVFHRKTSDHWAPGQVFEGKIGFDFSSVIGLDLGLTDIILGSDWLSDKNLSGIYLRELGKVFDILDDTLPPFKLNFFAQHKRPVYVSRETGREWDSWGRPYYRYKIDGEQNKLLCRISEFCNEKAIVSYCCPAFYTKKDLWESREDIIFKTNYAPPVKLRNHHIYSFVEAGGNGFAHSESEKIEGDSIISMINMKSNKEDNMSISQLVMNAGDAIKYAISESDDDNAIMIKRIVYGIIDKQKYYYGHRMAQAVAYIYAVRFVHGTSLLMIGDKP